jgi:MFS family permease
VTSSVADIAEPAAGGFWSVMRHRNYALLWTGQLISQLGDRLHWMAISLWVYQKTGSALSVSFAIMALLVGPAVIGLFAGAVVDRSDRRKVLVYSDLSRAALVFVIPELMSRNLHLVYLDLFLLSSVTAFFRPAMFSAIPESVPRSKLLQANALFASMDSAMEVFGPAIAGIVIVKFGYQGALYFDALSFLISGLLVANLRLGTVQRSRSVHFEYDLGETRGISSAIREGFVYVRRDAVQASLFAILIGGYWVAGLNSLQTPLAKGVLGVSDAGFALLQVSHGIGFIGGSLLAGLTGSLVSRGEAIILAYLLWALSVAAVGASVNYVVLAVSNFWVGLANMLVFVGVATVIMERTPRSMVGRVVTMRGAVVAVMRTLAMLGFGWMADRTDARVAVISMALMSVVGTLIAVRKFPALAAYDGVDLSGKKVAALTSLPHWVSRFGGAVGAYIADRVDAEFAPASQRVLNIIVTLAVLAGWLGVLVGNAGAAIGIAFTAVATAVGATAARAAYRRMLKPSGVGTGRPAWGKGGKSRRVPNNHPSRTDSDASRDTPRRGTRGVFPRAPVQTQGEGPELAAADDDSRGDYAGRTG